MSATSPNVGVRVFSDLTGQVASIDTRDSTVIGMTLPCPNMALEDQAEFELHKPVRISTDNPEQIAKLGEGVAKDTISQIASEGIITDIAFSRIEEGADIAATIGNIAGDAALKTGIWSLLEAKGEIGLEPGLIICPGYTEQRLDDAANPVAVAMDGICTRLIDCLAVCDTPDTSREDAAEWAADFATSLNMLAMYPKALVTLGGENVTRPLSPNAAAAIVRSDKANGHPFKAFWNKGLVGIRGVSQTVTYIDGQTTHDANFLNFAGVGTVIENRLLWSPFNTGTDPTTEGYRSIKRVRTRRSIEKAIPRALRLYMGQDLGPHLVTLIMRSLAEACEERKALGAIIDYEVIWDRAMNPDTLLRDGGLRLRLKFEETPDLTDLQIYSEPQPEAFAVLAAGIQQAIENLGNPNIRAIL